MVRINLNEHIKVKLTPRGEEILNISGWIISKPNYLGEYTFQLWDLMEIFGPHILSDRRQIFVENTFVIGDANEHV